MLYVKPIPLLKWRKCVKNKSNYLRKDPGTPPYSFSSESSDTLERVFA